MLRLAPAGLSFCDRDPGRLRRFHEAKLAGSSEVLVWGSGRPRREFLYVDDLADASLHLLRHYSGESHVNIGAGYDITIAEFAENVKRCVGFEGQILYDGSRPDGMPRKLLDSSRIHALGWSAVTPLDQGLGQYYEWFLSNQARLRGAVIGGPVSGRLTPQY